MAASAIFRSGAFGRMSRRPPGRLSVIAWAIAAVALMATAASAFIQSHPTAFAVVARPTEAIDTDHPADPIAAPSEALIDPRGFRRPPPPVDGRPRVAIVVTGLGISAKQTAAATGLPADISLSFSPYGRSLQKQADDARAAGHEIFVEIPLEPEGYPGNDAGPQAILISLTPAENVERLRWSLARFTGFAGVVLAGGSPALQKADTISPLLKGASVAGLVWAHTEGRGFDGSAAETADITVAIDAKADGRAIDSALEDLEALARSNGSALALAHAYPVTLQRLAVWAEALEARGVVLVPASALARAPDAQHTAEAGTAAHGTEAAHEAEPAHHDAEAPAASVEPPPPVSDGHGDHH